MSFINELAEQRGEFFMPKGIDLLAVSQACNEVDRLRKALADCAAAFHVTLMVLDERANGETDPDKRYAFASKHPEIIAAQAALKGHKEAL